MSLDLHHITRQFPGVTALENVSLSFLPGEVHAICGENGAGKSTLINIVSGNLSPSSGEMLLDGAPLHFENPLQALSRGIAVVHQEKSLVDTLSIAENIFAGQQPANKWGFIQFARLYRQTKVLLERLQLTHLSPDTPVGQLSSAQKQLIEIAKALSKNPSILLLDEPTASITEKETQLLFGIIRQLKSQGVAILYISHRMAEIFAIADKVSVLKDGKFQGTKAIADTNINELIRLMVGRDICPPEPGAPLQENTLLEVNGLTGKGFANIDLTIRKGEIVGLAGLIGSGRTELAKALFGAIPATEGNIRLKNNQLNIKSIPQAIRAGIGYLPEERKTEGIFGSMTVEENIVAAHLAAVKKKGWFSRQKMRTIAGHYKALLRINTPNLHQRMDNLSGGNQQKIVFAKWLLRNPQILIADEPTHGVDIGAKFEIYKLLRQQASEGKGILLISSELPELLLLSDTILVLRNGVLARKMSRAEATEETIMQAACGF